MANNRLPAWSHLAVCIHEQVAILFRQEEAGGQGIDRDVWTVLLRHMHCQPLREIDNGGFGSTNCVPISNYGLYSTSGIALQRSLRGVTTFLPVKIPAKQGGEKYQTRSLFPGSNLSIVVHRIRRFGRRTTMSVLTKEHS